MFKLSFAGINSMELLEIILISGKSGEDEFCVDFEPSELHQQLSRNRSEIGVWP